VVWADEDDQPVEDIESLDGQKQNQAQTENPLLCSDPSWPPAATSACNSMSQNTIDLRGSRAAMQMVPERLQVFGRPLWIIHWHQVAATRFKNAIATAP